MLKLTAIVYVDPHEEDGDPDEIADDIVQSFNSGMADALAGFPDGAVVQAKVVDAERVEQEELEREGLVE